MWSIVALAAAVSGGSVNTCERNGLEIALRELRIGSANVFDLENSSTNPIGSVQIRLTNDLFITPTNPTGEADCTVTYSGFDGENCALSEHAECTFYDVNG